MNTLTVDQVKAVYAAEKARKDVPPGFDPKQAARVRTKEKLQELNPLPYSQLPGEMQAQRDRRTALTRVEHAQHVAHLRSQVTEADHQAFALARGTKDAEGVLDAHHFAQKMHQKGLWAEADRLVGEALK